MSSSNLLYRGTLAFGLLFFVNVSCGSSGAETRSASPQTATIVHVGQSPEPTESNTPTLVPALIIGTATPLGASPTFVETPTPSNAAVMTSVAQGAQPTLVFPAPPNETGIIPGVSTAEQVISILGEPTYKDPAPYNGVISWGWKNPSVKNLLGIGFSGEIVQGISLNTPNTTAEMIVALHGVPEWVIYYPSPDINSLTKPSTRAPIAPPMGELLYLSKGLKVHFFCDPSKTFVACQAVQTCKSIPREAPIQWKDYAIPLSITEWIRQEHLSDQRFCIRPWSGFGG